MRNRLLLLFVLCLTLMTTTALAKDVAGLPLHVQKFDSGAIRVWVGDHISSSATVAIPTKDGLVIIDTTGNPEVDRQLRQVIADELNRDDFITLINTHEHGDHTGGNIVYSDCTIVGHKLIEQAMNKSVEDAPRISEWLTTRIADLEKEIAALDLNAPEAARLKEDLILNRLELKVAQSGGKLVPPTKTFSESLVLDYGDTTFELYYIGGMHSASDIAIFVPQHGLLMTGDTMADVWLTDTPGCLASFTARSNVIHNFPLLLKNWNTLLAKKSSIKTLVTGHWNGELTFAGFEARVKNVEEIWDGVNLAAKSGGQLNEMFVQYDLATHFPNLVDSPGCTPRNNSSTIMEMWVESTNQKSAAETLYQLLDSDADATEIQKVVAQHNADSPSYFFLEVQINAMGYRFLQAERVQQAQAMFKINVDLFPESWNVYDSFGEALFMAQDHEQAIAMYEKSLELNPESPSGQEMLDRIRSESTVN